MSEKAKSYLGYCPAYEKETPSLATSRRYLSLCQAVLLDLPASVHLGIDETNEAFEVYVEYWEHDDENVEACQFCEEMAPSTWDDTQPYKFQPGCITINNETGDPEYKYDGEEA